MPPRRIALFIWLCIALLGGLCVVFPKDNIHIGWLELRWTTLASVLDMDHTQSTEEEELPAEETEYLDDTDFKNIQDKDLAEDTLSSGKEQGKNRENNFETQIRDTTLHQNHPAVDTRTYLSAFYS